MEIETPAISRPDTKHRCLHVKIHRKMAIQLRCEHGDARQVCPNALCHPNLLKLQMIDTSMVRMRNEASMVRLRGPNPKRAPIQGCREAKIAEGSQENAAHIVDGIITNVGGNRVGRCRRHSVSQCIDINRIACGIPSDGESRDRMGWRWGNGHTRCTGRIRNIRNITPNQQVGC